MVPDKNSNQMNKQTNRQKDRWYFIGPLLCGSKKLQCSELRSLEFNPRLLKRKKKTEIEPNISRLKVNVILSILFINQILLHVKIFFNLYQLNKAKKKKRKKKFILFLTLKILISLLNVNFHRLP